MVKPQLVNEAPVSLAEAREELERIKGRDGELSFRANKCVEYLNDFAGLPAAKAKDLIKKLRELDVARLKDEHLVMVADLLPRTVEEVKLIFQSGSTRIVSKKDMEAIAAIVAESVA